MEVKKMTVKKNPPVVNKQTWVDTKYFHHTMYIAYGQNMDG